MGKQKLIARKRLLKIIGDSLKLSPVVALMGARQTGKTTLARQLAVLRKGAFHFFDMENPADRVAMENPVQVFDSLEGVVIIDEVQLVPGIFSVLRPYCDRRPLRLRFCLLGSASPQIIRGISESLAGRIRFIDIHGFSLDEIGWIEQNALWLRGGFPMSYLASSSLESMKWRRDFINTHLERDLNLFGIHVNPNTIYRFWSMLAHYHGQVWNGEEIARSLAVTGKTARHYLDILSGTYALRVLPPWFVNIGKRLVKSPKLYFRDSGILHSFLSIETMRGLFENPRYGASWEGFALEQILSVVEIGRPYFWATQNGAELDMLLEHDGRKIGFEFKCADAPTMTKSMRISMDDLKLEKLFVVYPGSKSYYLDKNISVLPLKECMLEVQDMKL